MRPKVYALGLTAMAAALFLGTVTANITIDPQRVFGTGLLCSPLNQNDRYLALARYEEQADHYDALFLSSSRGGAFSIDELSRRMNGSRFARFSMPGAQVGEYLAILDHVIRGKADRNLRLSAVFMLLDIDSLGGRPVSKLGLQYQLPPALTGESMGRFRWRYLVAIQFQTWRGEITRAWNNCRGGGNRTERHASERSETDGLAPPDGLATPVGLSGKKTITAHANYSPQLAQLKDFVALCRQNNIRLTVALSPLHEQRLREYSAEDLKHAVDDVSNIVPVWYFASPHWLSSPDLWTDIGHFTPKVSEMMLERIFAERPPSELDDFGRLYGNQLENQSAELR